MIQGPSRWIWDAGTGRSVMSCRNSVLKSYGIDRSASGIQIVREVFSEVQFALGDVEAELSPDPFQIDCFDVVVSTEVVEHLYRPRRLIQNAFQLLKPSGYFITSTPYHGYVKKCCWR